MHIASLKKNTVILGAGITGLSTAHYLSLKNDDFLVLEKNNKVGGNISSEKKEGFIIENGPNTVLLNNDSIVRLIKVYDLWDNISLPKESAESNRYVLLNNKLQLLPRNYLEFFKSPLLSLKEKTCLQLNLVLKMLLSLLVYILIQEKLEILIKLKNFI